MLVWKRLYSSTAERNLMVKSKHGKTCNNCFEIDMEFFGVFAFYFLTNFKRENAIGSFYFMA